MLINQSYIKKIVFGFVLLHFVFFCLALFANTSFAFPVADDMLFSKQVDERGVLSFMTYRYQSWNGRYAADAAFGVLYRLFDIETTYAIALCIPILCALIGYMYMLRSLLWLTNTKLKHEKQGLFFTYWLLLFMLTALQHPGQSVYALNGSATYLLGSSLALIFVVSIIRSTVTPRPQYRPAQYALLVVWYAIYSFFVTGFNESLMLMMAVVVGVGWCWVVRYRRQHVWLWSGALLANIYGIYTVVVAPGNSVRVNVLTDSSTINSLAQSTSYIDLLVNAVVNTGFICVLTIVVYLVVRSLPILGSYIIRLERFFDTFVARQSGSWRIIMCVAYPILIGAGLLATIFVREGLGPYRVRDGIYYFVLPFIPLCMAYWKNIASSVVNRSVMLQRLRSAPTSRVARPLVASISVVLFAVLFFGNFQRINNDMVREIISDNIAGAPLQLLIDGYSRGREYADSVHNRELAIVSAKNAGATVVTVFPLCTIAPTLHYQLWHDNPSLHPNTVIARYYGVGAIEQTTGGCH